MPTSEESIHRTQADDSLSYDIVIMGIPTFQYSNQNITSPSAVSKLREEKGRPLPSWATLKEVSGWESQHRGSYISAYYGAPLSLVVLLVPLLDCKKALLKFCIEHYASLLYDAQIPGN